MEGNSEHTELLGARKLARPRSDLARMWWCVFLTHGSTTIQPPRRPSSSPGLLSISHPRPLPQADMVLKAHHHLPPTRDKNTKETSRSGGAPSCPRPSPAGPAPSTPLPPFVLRFLPQHPRARIPQGPAAPFCLLGFGSREGSCLVLARCATGRERATTASACARGT